jgi:hypothetical protein
MKYSTPAWFIVYQFLLLERNYQGLKNNNRYLAALRCILKKLFNKYTIFSSSIHKAKLIYSQPGLQTQEVY